MSVRKNGEVQFEITKQHFGEEGFRRAFKALSDNMLFQNKSWVLKKYHESSKKVLDVLGTDVECQTRKAVQMHCLPRHLAFAFEQLCNSNSAHLDSPSVITKSITVCMVVSMLQLRST